MFCTIVHYEASMLWGFNITVTEENMIDSHAHDIHEFVICRSNTGTFVVDGKAYELRKGLSFYLPGGGYPSDNRFQEDAC